MPKTTQDGRLLKITTPLGKDHLLIEKMEMKEEISSLFEIKIELLFDEEEDDKFDITPIDITKILGQTVNITLTQTDKSKTERIFTGMINRFSQGGRNRRYTFYTATIVPHIWKLTQITQSRIFQHKTVPDILKEVFAGFNFKMQTEDTYEPRNYCVQYQETDFAFASRLMEEEGIYYYFEHTKDAVYMILRDGFRSPENCPKKHEVPMHNEDLNPDEDWESAVKSIQTEYSLLTGVVTTWDYNFELVGKTLDSEQQSSINVGGNRNLENYTFPAGYARKYDGIDKGGGEQAAELNKVFPDKDRTAKNRIKALDSQYKIVKGISDCCSLTAGYRFHLKNHPNKEFNIQYILLSVNHTVNQMPSYIAGKESEPVQVYKNDFNCIAHGSGQPEFRPALKTPKPRIHGSQTAIVVGPAGEEIFTDKYGRVKVQFHWDRDGKRDADSSCWVRVATMWSGKLWGTIAIPRINMEVVVDFLEGDPDQPIITGSVYNAQAMPPYKLPDEKTKMTIKSDSSKGGGGFNELRFEDKKGSEQIFIHGQKDLDVRILKDRREWTGKDQHLVVKNDRREKIDQDTHLSVGRHQHEEIKGDKHLHVKGKEAIKIDQSLSIEVGGTTTTKFNGGHSSETGQSYYIKGGNVVIEGTTTLTINVGGNFISINSGGIFIKGTMVMINSGGAATPGTPGNLVPPAAPAVADDADNNQPGAKLRLDFASQARRQKRFNPASSGGSGGAGDGTDKKPQHWVGVKLINEANEPVPGKSFDVILPDGSVYSGTTDEQGKAKIEGIEQAGNCKISFTDLDEGAWEDA